MARRTEHDVVIDRGKIKLPSPAGDLLDFRSKGIQVVSREFVPVPDARFWAEDRQQAFQYSRCGVEGRFASPEQSLASTDPHPKLLAIAEEEAIEVQKWVEERFGSLLFLRSMAYPSWLPTYSSDCGSRRGYSSRLRSTSSRWKRCVGAFTLGNGCYQCWERRERTNRHITLARTHRSTLSCHCGVRCWDPWGGGFLWPTHISSSDKKFM